MRILALALAALTTGLNAPAAARVFRAGAYEVDVTPKRFPILVSGNFFAASAGRALDRLFARALALDDGKTRVVISVVDTLMMPRELLDRVKAKASRSTGIPPARMLISATHTHSAPPVMGALGTDPVPEYADFLALQIVKVIEGAVKRLEPARVGWAVAQAPDYTHCRRWILRPDRIRKDPFGQLTVRANMHPGYQNPDFIGPAGPSDPELSLVAVQSPEGRPIALLANYSMHYVGVGGGVVSADYFGHFAGILRECAGVVMMSQGTAGDQHWMDYSKPKQTTTPARYAEALAGIAQQALKRVNYRDGAAIVMAETKLKLGRRLPDAQRLEWARRILARMGNAAPRTQEEVYAREQIFLLKEPVRELKLQALRIGDLGIAAFPAEVFASTGLKIKRQSPLAHTFNIELANGAEGYIPPPEQHALGGYTTWPARTAGLEIEAEPKILRAMLGLLERLIR